MEPKNVHCNKALFALLTGWLLAFLPGCAARMQSYKVEILHRDALLDNESFSGQSIMLMPPFSESGFNASPELSPLAQARPLSATRSDLKPCYFSDFMETAIKAYSKEEFEGFCHNLFSGNILALQTADTVWQLAQCRYALAVRIVQGARVRGFDGKLKRRVRLEGELWDTREAGVVWRAAALGVDNDVRSSDADYIGEGIAALYKRLPAYRPGLNDENW